MPAPNQIRLDDGFSTIITFENIPTIKLYEKDITPPGVSSGAAIDTTTMRNTEWRTMAARQLKTITPVTAVVAFATEAIPLIHAQIGINQICIVTFPDGSALEFHGWIDEFTLSNFTEGTQPTATLKVQPSMVDNNGVEKAPRYAASVDSLPS